MTQTPTLTRPASRTFTILAAMAGVLAGSFGTFSMNPRGRFNSGGGFSQRVHGHGGKHTWHPPREEVLSARQRQRSARAAGRRRQILARHARQFRRAQIHLREAFGHHAQY